MTPPPSSPALQAAVLPEKYALQPPVPRRWVLEPDRAVDVKFRETYGVKRRPEGEEEDEEEEGGAEEETGGKDEEEEEEGLAAGVVPCGGRAEPVTLQTALMGILPWVELRGFVVRTDDARVATFWKARGVRVSVGTLLEFQSGPFSEQGLS